MQKTLDSIRYNQSIHTLKQWSLLRVTGADRESFFQGQVTNDLTAIQNHQGQLTARLNRQGKLQSFFYIAKMNDHLLLLCPQELAAFIKEDFEKFIIMEDVQIESMEQQLFLHFNYFLSDDQRHQLTDSFDLIFYGLMARLIYRPNLSLPLTNPLELESTRIQNGWPKWNVDVSNQSFINDSTLNEIAISYNKGCFLGQETVAKIENNRGAAYYPVMLEFKNKQDFTSSIGMDFLIEENNEKRKGGTLDYQIGQLIQARLYRDFRIEGRQLQIIVNEQKLIVLVKRLPLHANINRKDLSLELFHLGINLFQDNEILEAITAMEKSIEFDPFHGDAFESLGVMLGRLERYDEAIELMNKLLIVNPHSVMAHTNKSLYLMKQGKIEEAEAEKSLATVKSFSMFGEEARIKKVMVEAEAQKNQDILRREKMFLQVLEIDDQDSIALFGMADIFFHRKEFDKAVENLNKVILVDKNYSTAYSLLGKALEAQGDFIKASEVYNAGILIASKRGDMMPANEMQSRLNNLVMRVTSR